MDDGTFQANDHSLNRLVIESRVFTGISNIEYVKFLYSEVVLGVIFKVRSECEQFQPKSRSKTIFKHCRTFSLLSLSRYLSLSIYLSIWKRCFEVISIWRWWICVEEVKWSEAEGGAFSSFTCESRMFSCFMWLWHRVSYLYACT